MKAPWGKLFYWNTLADSRLGVEEARAYLESEATDFSASVVERAGRNDLSNFNWRAVMLDFENFSSRARRSMNRAQAEAHWLGDNFVGSEQLLLGVLGTDEAIARSIGVTLETVRAEVERTIGRGSGYVKARSPLTPRARQIVQAAMAIAQEHSFARVEPEHLLLALIDLEDAVGYQVLSKLGVFIPQLMQAILAKMQELPRQPVPQADEIEDEESITEISLLPAVPPATRAAPTLLTICWATTGKRTLGRSSQRLW